LVNEIVFVHEGENFAELKEGENYNRRNTLKVFRGLQFSSDAEVRQIGHLWMGAK
jgi:hypothetical protein